MDKKHFHIKKAVIFIFCASVSFSVMAFFVKLASSYTNTSMIIFFRFGINFFYVLAILAVRNLQNRKISLKTNRIFLHIFRSLISLLTMFLFYFSLKYIPLVEGNLLIMTNSLFIPILGAIFLHHKTSKKHWMAVIIGFIGVAFILKPGHELFNLMSLMALASGLCLAISFLSLRILSKHDGPYVYMFYYFFISFLFSSFVVIFNWKTPDSHDLILLFFISIFAAFYQEFLVRAASYAPAKIISSLLYTSLIFSAFLGWLFFKNIPDLITFLGIILVSFSSILIVIYAKK